MKGHAGSRVFLITGASAGIGAATARHAASAGHRVVLAARSKDKLDALVSQLGGIERALPISCDVTDWESQKHMVSRALEHFGRIDVVFANAGVLKGSAFLGGDDSPDEWREMVLANILGVATTARLTLPELIRRRGHLLITGSAAGRTTDLQSLYAATKWAVTGMAQAIRNQLAGTGVRVTLIEPGFTRTSIGAKPEPNTPMLHADDVARAVMYATNQPESVDVNEILVRSVGEAR